MQRGAWRFPGPAALMVPRSPRTCCVPQRRSDTRGPPGQPCWESKLMPGQGAAGPALDRRTTRSWTQWLLKSCIFMPKKLLLT